MKKLVLTGMATMLLSTTAMAAAKCDFKMLREACPGKEEVAFKPYGGKNETPEGKQVADEKACVALAEGDSKIRRKGTLKSKKAHSITFDGKAVAGTFEDKAECK